ncbi:MAG TPA: hypothetical protein PK753_06170 [Ignavibacteria bacterium]|nr:hypothetical protein [Ignavibacteria bacterium]
MRDIENYFDKPTFVGLVLILPSTIVLASILLRAFESDLLYRVLYDIKRSVNPFIVMNITALLSLLICFSNIIRINAQKVSGSEEERIIYSKSFVNIAVIFINISYILIIYFCHDLEKLGNIPVGRN